MKPWNAHIVLICKVLKKRLSLGLKHKVKHLKQFWKFSVSASSQIKGKKSWSCLSLWTQCLVYIHALELWFTLDSLNMQNLQFELSGQYSGQNATYKTL